jgi:hypothetical protein
VCKCTARANAAAAPHLNLDLLIPDLLLDLRGLELVGELSLGFLKK